MKFRGKGRVCRTSSKNFLFETLLAQSRTTGAAAIIAKSRCDVPAAVKDSLPAASALQFGKMEDGLYSLDMGSPFCALQAFGTFLAAFDWHPRPDAEDIVL
jgi:hypothetical protein